MQQRTNLFHLSQPESKVDCKDRKVDANLFVIGCDDAKFITSEERGGATKQ